MERRAWLAVLLTMAVAATVTVTPQHYDAAVSGTFSIVARDPVTGELGMGVQSKALAAGSRTMTVKGGVAAIAHQVASNPMYGSIGLELLAAGMTPQQALDTMLRGDEGRERRQVAIIDAQGRTAAWTGGGADDWKGHQCGANFCAQGGFLAGPEVVGAMVRSFQSTNEPLAERLVAALDAAQAAGGDARGVQAAALVVAKPLAGAAGFGDRVVDLRVDDHREPLVELRRLLKMHRAGQRITEANQKLAAGDVAGAVEAAQAASAMSPENDFAWVTLALTYLRQGRKHEALAAISRAVELNPANKRQLQQNRDFTAVYDDPEFRVLVESGK